MTTTTSKTFVVVLAGGEGTRLAPLTRALYGHDLPKQFAVLAGEKSLLQETVERALRMVCARRVLVVVTAHREAVAREQLRGYPGIELLVQPTNLDTAPGMMFPLAWIAARVPRARVVFLPSDHYIANDAPLSTALARCARGALRDRLVLVGVTPTGPEVEYGWIVRGARIARGPGHAVARFVEKPDAAVAEDLWRAGGLWNTFISAGPVETFWTLARQHLPTHAELLETYALHAGQPTEAAALAHAFRELRPANFSRDVLAHAADLAVLPVSDSGWSDWGSPRRVFATLAGTPSHERLVGRLREISLAALAG